MKAFLIDEGVLLTKQNEEYESYAVVYDQKYGYYDEGQYYLADKNKALEEAALYVKNGVEMTYAVVSETILPDDFDFDEGCVEDEEYLLEHIVYSAAKIDGQIVENFIDTSKDRDVSQCVQKAKPEMDER